MPIVFAVTLPSGRLRGATRPSLTGSPPVGISFVSAEVGAKQLGLLRELQPSVARIAVVLDPKWPITEPFVSQVRGCGVGHGTANRRPLRQQRPRNRDRLYHARPT